MLLKSVEMQGFKSFADKIYLDFNPGITAIVGPNGSGKSNISDAIRWVMGEQSIKTLRGSKMEDVIFSGTQSRKAMGFAEVSLNLDNSQGFFPLDYDEITVTRRVYRSGEGEYFINRVGCRLKDIHELFMDTGLGREGYSIIGQGKIDEILSNKSEDRRQIFEEAAGITKYKYRKNEAERKLSHTTDNLTRVKDIMAELENQIGPLFEQSEKAKKYLKLRDELKTIEINLSVVKIDSLKEKIKVLTENLTQTDGEIEKIRADVEKNEEAVNEIYENVAKWDKEMEEFRDSEKSVLGSIGEENSLISVLLADIGHYEESIKKLEESVDLYIEDEKQAEKYLAELIAGLEVFETKAAEIQSKREDCEERIEKINELTQTQNSLLEDIKTDIIQTGAEISRENERISGGETLKQNFIERLNTAKAELLEKAEGYKRLESLTAELKVSAEESGQSLDRLEKSRDSISEEIERERAVYQEILERIENTNSNLNRAISQKNVLEEMEKGYEGFAFGVKAVMNEASGGRLGHANIYGPFAKLVKTQDKYAMAIDTALGNAGQNIVVGNEEDAKTAIRYLKENKAGRVTFLPVSTVQGRSVDVSKLKGLEGFIDIASNLVEIDKKYDVIKSSLLGATVIADNIDNAAKLAKAAEYKIKIVTLSGEVVQTGGAMTGGSFNKSSGFLSRGAEITALKASIEELEKSLKQSKNEAGLKSEEIGKLTERLARENKEITALRDKHIKAKADFEHYKSFLENVTASKEQTEKEILAINQDIEKLDKENAERKQSIAQMEQRIDELNQKAHAEQQGFDELLKEARDANDGLVEIIIAQNSCEKDILSQKEKVNSAQNSMKNNEEKRLEADREKAGLEEKINSAKSKIESGKTGIEELKMLSLEAEEKIKSLSEQKTEAEGKIRAIQKEITGTNDIMLGLSNQKAKLETKAAKHEAELEGIFARLWEEYEMSYSSAVDAADKNADLSNAERDITSLKSKIKNLGNINIDAIESYREIKERYDFLLVQTNDLEKAKVDLEKIISEMLVIMKKQFSEQFEIINHNFNKVFAQLFGGGHATLSLADPENLLESGIEIEAQPPGKKLQRLSLLSGGERALTAIALLFAILNVRPTPFCILDEIEAALDDVNVSRYADYLKKYSEKTQFIVVTHRRGTMESANILYGVTMQERGVSKLLSLNIDEVAK